MKDEVLDGLLVARTLFDVARTQCFVRDRHVASAGLNVLQDAVELVLYSCLLELGVDHVEPVDKLSFDQLIGSLQKAGSAVAKSCTLKAMNKQRVLIKHHAQLAEPRQVQKYYEMALVSVNDLLGKVIGKGLHEVVVADVISDPEQQQIREAGAAIEGGRYLEAMVCTRRALFLAVERHYDVRPFEFVEEEWERTLVGIGNRAPYYTRTPYWISMNVTEPAKYVQLDHQRIQMDMMALGIDPEELFNVQRLTPPAYQHPQFGWMESKRAHDEATATEENARYCLDVVVSIARRVGARKDIVRTRSASPGLYARLNRDQPLSTHAKADSGPAGYNLRQGGVWQVDSIVAGLDGGGECVRTFGRTRFGYIPLEPCDLLAEGEQPANLANLPGESHLPPE